MARCNKCCWLQLCSEISDERGRDRLRRSGLSGPFNKGVQERHPVPPLTMPFGGNLGNSGQGWTADQQLLDQCRAFLSFRPQPAPCATSAASVDTQLGLVPLQDRSKSVLMSRNVSGTVGDAQRRGNSRNTTIAVGSGEDEELKWWAERLKDGPEASLPFGKADGQSWEAKERKHSRNWDTGNLLDYFGASQRAEIAGFLASCRLTGRLATGRALVSVISLCKAPSTLYQYKKIEEKRRCDAECQGIDPEAAFSLVGYLLRSGPKSPSSVRSQIAAFQFFNGGIPSGARQLSNWVEEASSRCRVAKKPSAKPDGVQDIGEILLHAERTNTLASRRAAAMIVLLYGAHLRISECLALDMADVRQAEPGVFGIMISSAKNDQDGNGRTTFVRADPGTVSYRALEWWLSRANEGPLFPSRNGRLGYAAAAKHIVRTAADAGVTIKGTHVFRKAATSFGIGKGVPQHLMQRRGRWKSAKGMEPYITDSLETQGGTTLLP